MAVLPWPTVVRLHVHSYNPLVMELWLMKEVENFKDKLVEENFYRIIEINLRGLNGIQGPVYVGTGCVFNRTNLYGYEPLIKKKKPSFFSWLCGGKKKTTKSKKKSSEKKMSHKHVDNSMPVFKLEDIEEGVEGVGFDDERSLLMSQMSL